MCQIWLLKPTGYIIDRKCISFFFFLVSEFCATVVTTPLHLAIVVHGDIQERIVEMIYFILCLCSGDVRLHSSSCQRWIII